MKNTMLTVTVVLMTSFAMAADQPAMKHGSTKGTSSGASAAAKIKQAMSAAPADIAGGATIMDWPDTPNGEMKQMRAGTNGWTCMPSTPTEFGGASGEDPMCLDKAFMEWAGAWMSKKDPQVKSMGIAYMLRGDKGVSNTDPFATSPTADNQWIVSPPHVMVVMPDLSQLEGMSTDPHNGGPWVMWKGTKYAHIMVPTAPMPKAAKAKK